MRTMVARTAAGLVAAVVAGVLAAGLLAAAASPAHAATGYRYWSFWQRDGGSWTFAQTGPATTTPSDGTVEGWRFAVSADSASAARPRGDAEFARICSNTQPRAGMKRVALVLDAGTPADAPGGATPPSPHTACARVGDGASAADALAAVAKPLRYSSAGMVCAIAGYPQTGCGEAVTGPATGAGSAAASAPPASDASRPSGTGPSIGLFGGAAAVVALGAAALWQARRRRRQP